MKQLFLTGFILISLCSCNSDDYDDDRSKRYSHNIDGRLNRSADKLIGRVKPSESMQAGIPKRNGSAFTRFDDEDKNYSGSMSQELYMPNGQYTGYFKIGNPYQIQGISYFPQNYTSYEEVGIASWYGDNFHGNATANGEIYNMNEMTAAHRTLPLPSLVRVTNLRNGKSAVVRVNDRGPFAKNRIIDVSEKAADTLGFKDIGTTNVRVELLRNDTDELLTKLKIKN